MTDYIPSQVASLTSWYNDDVETYFIANYPTGTLWLDLKDSEKSHVASLVQARWSVLPFNEETRNYITIHSGLGEPLLGAYLMHCRALAESQGNPQSLEEIINPGDSERNILAGIPLFSQTIIARFLDRQYTPDETKNPLVPKKLTIGVTSTGSSPTTGGSPTQDVDLSSYATLAALAQETTNRVAGDQEISDRLDLDEFALTQHTSQIAQEKAERIAGDTALGERIDALPTTGGGGDAEIKHLDSHEAPVTQPANAGELIVNNDGKLYVSGDRAVVHNTDPVFTTSIIGTGSVSAQGTFRGITLSFLNLPLKGQWGYNLFINTFQQQQNNADASLTNVSWNELTQYLHDESINSGFATSSRFIGVFSAHSVTEARKRAARARANYDGTASTYYFITTVGTDYEFNRFTAWTQGTVTTYEDPFWRGTTSDQEFLEQINRLDSTISSLDSRVVGNSDDILIAQNNITTVTATANAAVRQEQINTAFSQIQSNDSDIVTLGNRIAALENAPAPTSAGTWTHVGQSFDTNLTAWPSFSERIPISPISGNGIYTTRQALHDAFYGEGDNPPTNPPVLWMFDHNGLTTLYAGVDYQPNVISVHFRRTNQGYSVAVSSKTSGGRELAISIEGTEGYNPAVPNNVTRAFNVWVLK